MINLGDLIAIQHLKRDFNAATNKHGVTFEEYLLYTTKISLEQSIDHLVIKVESLEKRISEFEQ